VSCATPAVYATQQTSGGHLWPSITFATALSGYGPHVKVLVQRASLVLCKSAQRASLVLYKRRRCMQVALTLFFCRHFHLATALIYICAQVWSLGV